MFMVTTSRKNSRKVRTMLMPELLPRSWPWRSTSLSLLYWTVFTGQPQEIEWTFRWKHWENPVEPLLESSHFPRSNRERKAVILSPEECSVLWCQQPLSSCSCMLYGHMRREWGNGKLGRSGEWWVRSHRCCPIGLLPPQLTAVASIGLMVSLPFQGGELEFCTSICRNFSLQIHLSQTAIEMLSCLLVFVSLNLKTFQNLASFPSLWCSSCAACPLFCCINQSLSLGMEWTHIIHIAWMYATRLPCLFYYKMEEMLPVPLIFLSCLLWYRSNQPIF